MERIEAQNRRYGKGEIPFTHPRLDEPIGKFFVIAKNDHINSAK